MPQSLVPGPPPASTRMLLTTARVAAATLVRGPVASPRQQPTVLFDERSHRVGDRIEDLSFRTVDDAPGAAARTIADLLADH